jgi:hypothetical protein
MTALTDERTCAGFWRMALGLVAIVAGGSPAGVAAETIFVEELRVSHTELLAGQDFFVTTRTRGGFSLDGRKLRLSFVSSERQKFSLDPVDAAPVARIDDKHWVARFRFPAFQPSASLVLDRIDYSRPHCTHSLETEGSGVYRLTRFGPPQTGCEENGPTQIPVARLQVRGQAVSDRDPPVVQLVQVEGGKARMGEGIRIRLEVADAVGLRTDGPVYAIFRRVLDYGYSSRHGFEVSALPVPTADGKGWWLLGRVDKPLDPRDPYGIQPGEHYLANLELQDAMGNRLLCYGRGEGAPLRCEHASHPHELPSIKVTIEGLEDFGSRALRTGRR